MILFPVSPSQQSLTLDSDTVAHEFSMSFNNRAFTVGETLVFQFDKKLYSVTVKEIEGTSFFIDNPLICLGLFIFDKF